MTQEEKQLLIKDLCSRLPYGVKGLHREQVHIITNMDGSSLYPSINVDGYDAWFPIETFKPYLRPMSSMTEEEKEDYKKTFETYENIMGVKLTYTSYGSYDWLNKKMFDYRDLIPMGLAMEATDGMYKNE